MSQSDYSLIGVLLIAIFAGAMTLLRIGFWAIDSKAEAATRAGKGRAKMPYKHMSESEYKRLSALYSALKDDSAGFAIGEVTDSLVGAVLREGDSVESVYMHGYGNEHIHMVIAVTSRGDRYMVMDVFGPFAVRMEKGA